ncbi:FAD/NAD(P)-binding domain-containing protein [Phialemonium atrogriseum]|uniref:FAD/NAD(P)-binding domain-containing protein n=1 Tax=Phialemonium atrogriseum TaxID=1093897 RepID=A0AAJ0BUG6_9PEZI|nr:FAD/NAD(P)-binding domain-containing protein [Phialemonium atrogriseum]KAK1764515.1 FAD/NAD(P)-binding domain-containing protein [Phialemonium atrogriseum]
MRVTGADGVAEPNSSGITVIVIGLGYAGCVAAVECHRKGHKVIVFEQAPEITALGDVIGITGNAAQIISKWGDGKVHDQLEPFLCDYTRQNIHNSKGQLLVSHSMLGYSAGSGYAANRGDMAIVFYNHVKELGIEVHLGKRVTEYFETREQAGVIVDGKRWPADCVLACDGVHSKARGFIIGSSASPHSTGYAVYRAWFDGKKALADPDLAWLVEGNKDKMETFIGPETHCIIGTGRRCRDIVWTCTHRDTYDIAESWSFPGKIEDALKVVEGWDPRIAKVMKKTPENQLIDYKLLWRDPLPGWVSKHGRMMLVGDSAHPFLPTSGQGAGQAIEDAATVAICLELAGKDRIPLALRTSEKIRYARATLAQKIGIETRDAWHKTDWEAAKKNPRLLEMPRPDWLFGHDPQEYAYEEFATAALAVLTGGEYVPRNVPPPGQSHRTDDFSGKKMKAWKVAHPTAKL